MANQTQLKDASPIAQPCFVKLVKMKTDDVEEAGTKRKRVKCNQDVESETKRTKTNQEVATESKQHARHKALPTAVDQCYTDESNDDGGSDVSNTSTATKKKRQHTTPQLNKLQEIEDRSPLCVVGENEANIFPKKINFMNHKIDVMYDSRVHMWLKADDFAKALGYKNYKSSIERFVHPSFVKTFPEVLDMSRARYGDAFRLYSVNSKVLFINEAGVLQLLLRSMISNDTVTKGEKAQTDESQPDPAAAKTRGTKSQPKPKLSADWINYQILPSLVAFSEAAKNGITAQEERRLQSMSQSFSQ